MISFDVQFRESEGGVNFHRLYSEFQTRRGIHESTADVARDWTEEYLRGISAVRHKSAQALGATPTGALKKAAERVTATASADQATVHVMGNLFARVFGDVTITPKASRALTIPIHAAAYGKRVGELKAQGWVFFMPRKEGADGKVGPILWAEDPNGVAWPMYVLVPSVTQSQDRTLLPSDEAYLAAAEQGARNYLEKIADQ